MARVEISLGVFSGDDSYCSLKPRTSGVTPRTNMYIQAKEACISMDAFDSCT